MEAGNGACFRLLRAQTYVPASELVQQSCPPAPPWARPLPCSRAAHQHCRGRVPSPAMLTILAFIILFYFYQFDTEKFIPLIWVPFGNEYSGHFPTDSYIQQLFILFMQLLGKKSF